MVLHPEKQKKLSLSAPSSKQRETTLVLAGQTASVRTLTAALYGIALKSNHKSGFFEFVYNQVLIAGSARTSTKFPGRLTAPVNRVAEQLFIQNIPLLLESPVKSASAEKIKIGWGGGGTETPQPNAITCLIDAGYKLKYES